MEEVTLEQQRAIAIARARRLRAEAEQAQKEPAGIGSLANLFNLEKIKQAFNPEYRPPSQDATEIANRMSGEIPDILHQNIASPGQKTLGEWGVENAPIIGATMASMLAPPLAAPAWLARLGVAASPVVRTGGAILAPAVINSPRIMAATAGGAGGGVFREGMTNPDASLSSLVTEGAKSGAQMGLAETLGGYATSIIMKGLGGAKHLPDIAKKAIDYARGKNAPLAASDVVESGVAGFPSKTIGGNIAETLAARRGNQIINTEIANITKGATTVDDAAMKGQMFFKDALQDASQAGKQAFRSFEQSVGTNAVVPLTNTAQAVNNAISGMERIGQSGSLMTRLKAIQSSGMESRSLAELEEIRKLALKSARKTPALKQTVNELESAIIKDYDAIGRQAGIDLPGLLIKAKEQWAKFGELRRVPGIDRFAREVGDRGAPAGTRNWISELFTQRNAQALNEIRKQAPQVYEELAAVNLSQIIQKHTRPGGMLGDALDGPALRAYVESNAKNLEAIYGTEAFKALDNFTAYAKFASPMVSRAGKSLGQLSPSEVFRGGALKTAEGAAVYKFPQIAIPGETAAFWFARKLTDPGSWLFKAFTEGVNVAVPVQEGIRLGARMAFNKKKESQD